MALRVAELVDMPEEVVFSAQPYPRISEGGRSAWRHWRCRRGDGPTPLNQSVAITLRKIPTVSV
jgi:hypothetical protein